MLEETLVFVFVIIQGVKSWSFSPGLITLHTEINAQILVFYRYRHFSSEERKDLAGAWTRHSVDMMFSRDAGRYNTVFIWCMMESKKVTCKYLFVRFLYRLLKNTFVRLSHHLFVDASLYMDAHVYYIYIYIIYNYVLKNQQNITVRLTSDEQDYRNCQLTFKCFFAQCICVV